MSAIQDKIAQAKAAGYSDADIAKHLATSPEYADKIKVATTAGYKPEEIVSHLADAPAPAAKVDAGNGSAIVDGIKGFGMGAGVGFGKVVLGAQRLVGKGLTALDGATSDTAPTLSSLVTGKKAPDTMLGRAGKWLVDDADMGRTNITAENAPYKAASPIANIAGEVGGSIVATLPVGGLLPNALRGAAGATKVIGIIPRAAQAAAVGAAYGGVTGATASNADTLGGMLADGARGAGTGAVLGGAITPASAVLGAIGGNAMQRASKTSAAEYAKQKIAEAFARDARGTLAASGQVNPLAQAASRFTKLGPEATLADAGGRNTNQLLDTLATLPGRTKEAAANVLHQRTAGVGERMRSAAERALGTNGQRLDSTVESLTNRRTLAANPLYAQLRTVDITPNDALTATVRAADELGAITLGRQIATARQQPFSLDPGAQGPARWNMGDLDHVKQGVDQMLQSSRAVRPDGTFTPLGNAYMSLKQSLTGELDNATMNPQTGASLYGQARAAFETPSALIDAARAGRQALTRDEAAIRTSTGGMDANELEAFRIGAFEGLRGKLGMQGGQTEIMNMWKNPATQEKLRVIFGSERAYREFAADAAKEARLKLLQSVDAGSRTAARHGGMGDLDLAAMSEAGHAVAAAKSGNVLAAIGSAKNSWNRVATPQAVRDQMGSLLLTKGAPGAQTLNSLEALVQSINNRNLQLSNNVGTFGGGFGSQVVTQPPPRQIR